MNENKGIKLTLDAPKKIGNFVNIKDEIIANAIRQRGGGQNQVNQIQTDYQNKTVGELANFATSVDALAKTAIKILKQARKKSEKYGGK